MCAQAHHCFPQECKLPLDMSNRVNVSVCVCVCVCVCVYVSVCV